MWRWLRGVGAGAMLGVTAMLAGPASADEIIHYASAPSWVKVAPVQTPTAGSDDGGPFRILLYDTQVRYGADGDEYYVDRAIQVLNRQALEGLGTVGQAWDPGTQSLTINRVEIIRDGQVINALATGDPFVTLRQETNLAQAVLDGRLTATKQLEDLRVGDIVRVATTTRYGDPMVKGHSQFAAGLAPGTPAIDYMRQRHLWGADKPMKWRAGEAFPKPVLTRTADGFELLAEARALKSPVYPAGAPFRYAQLGVLSLSDFAGWKEVSALFAAEYAAASTLKADSPLKAEVETIRKTHAGTLDRASAALALVQSRVRYLALAMGEGGFKPADADQTWSRRFGDCKGKSALLIALLKELGVEAEATAVSTVGDDGYDEILPRLAFDHVIVRAVIDGKTYWLDPTRQDDGAIERLAQPGYGWVLPLRAGGADLEQIHQILPALPDKETVIDADFTGGLDLDAPFKVRVTFHGDAAAFQYAYLSSGTRADAETALKQQWSTDNWLIDKASFGRADDGSVWVEVTGKFHQTWRLTGGRREFKAPYSSVDPDFDKREPDSIEPKAPYAMPFPSYDRYVTRLRLPRGGQGFEVVGPNADIKAAGQWVVRRARLEDGVAIIDEDDRVIGPEVSFAEATTGPARLKTAGVTEDVVIRAPANFRLTAAEATAVADARPGRDAFLQRAQANMTARDYDAALADLNRVLSENPDDVDALTRRVTVQVNRDDREAALKDLDTLLANDPKNVSYLMQRAQLNLTLERVDPAQADVEAAIAAAPGDYRPWAMKSQIANRRDDRPAAIEAMKEAVRVAPDEFYLQQSLIVLSYPDEKDSAARDAAFEKLHTDRIAASPQDPARYLARARSRFDRDHAGALADFDKAIALGPTASAYQARAALHRRLGDQAKARADLDAAVKLDTGGSALLARARYLSVQATPGAWLADAEAALKKFPQNPAMLEEVARAALVAGDKARAREAAEALVGLKPKDVEALRLRALIKEHSLDFVGAMADLRQAVAGPAGETPAGRSARLRLAALLGDVGHPAEGLAVLVDLSKAFPGDAEILERLCRLKATRNVEAASAAADCDAALNLQPGDADVYDSLGLAHLRLGAFDRAIAAYDEALKIRPGQSTSLFGRALAREGAGDLAGARADAALAARFDRGGLKEAAAWGLAARDPAVREALAAAPVTDLDKTLPKNAVVTRPNWAKTATPNYPERAQRASREGKVEIRCIVMSSGQLSNCRVEREWPQDFGFGATLLKATSQMRMRPMTVNGEPVDGAEVTFASPFLLD